MNDLTERVRSAGACLDARWDVDDVEAGLSRLRRTLRRRRARRLGAGALGVAVLAVGIWSAARGPGGRPPASAPLARRAPAPTPPAREAVPFHVGDGTLVTPLGPGSDLAATVVTPRQVRVRLASGAARFKVPRRIEREFRVEAGLVDVVVLGTEFRVAHQSGRVEVAVYRGRVRVAWRGGRAHLDAGQTGLFPPPAVQPGPVPQRPRMAAVPETRAQPGPAIEPVVAAVTEAPATSLAPAVLAPPVKGTEGLPAPAATPETRPGSPESPQTGLPGLRTTADEVDDLLAAADRARSAGDVSAAIAHLRLALVARPMDRTTAVVAFTLGRLLLDRAAEPRAAAKAFASARAAAPDGPLAEDALAREVEACAQAGDVRCARERATEYAERYPTGRRLASVKRLGNLD